MKRFVALLCVLALLFALLAVAGCKDEEQPEGNTEEQAGEQGGSEAPEVETSDDDIVNQDNHMGDDTKPDIFT